jgi:hypothetical protein|tara:strand:+ start:97 stop:837 length:741 start_codon:yes stop_codon:yes gene_type:complete
MKLYFAAAENHLEMFEGMKIDNLLMSFPFIVKKKINVRKTWFIDSGAFSAYTRNIDINIDEYIEFILMNDLEQYASLDVIGNAEETFNNYLYMKKKKAVNQIPAFHYGEDFKYLDIYLKECESVAIGGVAQLKSDRLKLFSFLDSCFNEISKHKNVKIHGYALNNWKILTRYPFYSVDATSWLNPTIYGQHFKYENGKLNRISHNQPFPNRFSDKDYRLKCSVIEFLKAEEYLTELWNKRGIVWNE